MRILGVFTKYWQPGQVKTRLGCKLGAEAAAAVYHGFIQHLAGALCECGDQRDFVVSPDHRVDDPGFNRFTDWNTVSQGDGNLGDRMRRYFTAAESADDCIVIIGGDCPTVDHARIEQAFESLKHSRVVIGPSTDGGYYLLGIRGPWDDAFDILFEHMPWGTGEVMWRTSVAVESLGLTPHLLPTDRDVDTQEDLDDLLKRLPRDPAGNKLRSAIRSALKISKEQQGERGG